MADPVRKKKKGTVVALVIVGALAAGGLYLHSKAAENAAKTMIVPMRIEVEAGTINRTVDGSGTLQPEDIYDVRIPSGVLVSETDFRVGDIISEGDIVASLDVDSINSCIVTVDQQLGAIDEALKDTHEMTEYQIEEYEARQAILQGQRERLLQLYSDPYVRAEADGIVMSITSPDASAVSSSNYGDIVSSLLGTVVVTPVKGENEPSDTAEAGDTDPSGTQTSQEGGEPSGTEGTSDTAEPSETAPSDTQPSGTDPSQTSPSDTTPSDTAPSDTAPSDTAVPSQTDPSDTQPSGTEPSSTDPAPTEAPSLTGITDFSAFALPVPARGAAPVRTIQDNPYFEGVITWGVGTEEFTGEAFGASTSYTALVMLTPKDGYCFNEQNLPQISGAAFSQSVVDPVSKVLTIIAIFPATEADPNAPATPEISGIPGVGDGSDIASDIASALQGVDLQQYIQEYIASQAAQATSGLDMSSLLGMPSGGIDYSSFTSGLQSSSSRPSAATPDVTIATIAGTESVNISIMVDELDILMIHEGQEVDIEIDAIENHYVGTISRVSNLADNSFEASGINLGTTNARYQIDISIPMESDMRMGMSATATVTVASVEDVPLIPMSALQQRGQELFVYGGFDSETGELIDEIPVTTGVSDGVNVEITSGLAAGDVIYCEDMGTSDILSMLM